MCYTEVDSAEYNGADIINILNMEKDKTKTVRVSINGESLKSSVNLISGETLGETFELKPYVPVFIITEKSKANADIILNAVSSMAILTVTAKEAKQSIITSQIRLHPIRLWRCSPFPMI